MLSHSPPYLPSCDSWPLRHGAAINPLHLRFAICCNGFGSSGSDCFFWKYTFQQKGILLLEKVGKLRRPTMKNPWQTTTNNTTNPIPLIQLFSFLSEEFLQLLESFIFLRTFHFSNCFSIPTHPWPRLHVTGLLLFLSSANRRRVPHSVSCPNLYDFPSSWPNCCCFILNHCCSFRV